MPNARADFNRRGLLSSPALPMGTVRPGSAFKSYS
ncbi:hypothetical protein CLOLEP_01190 [[Clostridium] leptum DSM 753]|uniref:Uncharacterized protein n=1 Tax=[Clostridium] leptum DSM 753 TaxID=428125 RepID=A7VRK6_9FIRM|nr:hypothetical protein CLOLEP_01190 [[Clostridium] leptum DSM 753]